MKKIAKKSFLLFLLFTLFITKSLLAEPLFKTLDDVIPTDPSILIVKLENEFTYYVKENNEPPNRISLRLVVNAGSILEDDHQRGLAHVLEHMAFNGTENFPDNSLISLLEKEGVRFGRDLNAFTSFDSTVYMISIPSGREDLLDTALLIMFDWASAITNEIEQMEKERGVVIEEWRHGKGAGERIAEVQRSVILGDSRYAERAPIGTIEVLENFTREDLVSFYNDWYRPDLMALIAVGDFDKNIIEKKIRERFSKLLIKEPRKERIEFPVPPRTANVVSIITDSETTSANVTILYLLDNPGESTVRDYRDALVSSLYISMLDSRYRERVSEANPPFARASAGVGRLVRTKSSFSVSCVAAPGNITGGFAALAAELSRVRQHGFTESEFERAKETYIRLFRNLYLEAANTNSETLAAEYSRHFLQGEFVPGIELEYRLTLELIQTITLDEINALSDRFIKDKGVTVLVSAPEGSELGGTEASREMIMEMFHAILAEKQEAYSDDVYDGDLVKNMPVPGEAVLEKIDRQRKIHYYRLSNGARLIIKQTDFRNDQILFSAFSRGGNSLATEQEWVSANFASAIVSNGRIGNLTKVQLDKYLQQKVVSVSPGISETSEGFSGNSSIEDLETLFQLVYLYFTQIEKDKNAFESYISRLNIQMKNRDLSPDVVFARTFFRILSGGNFRGLYFDTSSIPKIDINTAYDFFKRRFSNPGDFTFIFTGAVGADVIVPLAEKYLAFAPDKERLDPARRKMWRDNGLRYPEGNIKETIFMGKEEKATVVLCFTGNFIWTRENVLLLNALTHIANIRLRNVIREDESGTYSISVYPVISRFPFPQYQIVIYFMCSPDRAEELKEIALNEVANLSNEIPEGTLMKFINSTALGFENRLKDNSFWLSAIRDSEFDGSGLGWLDIYRLMIENITDHDMLKAAALYFNMENMIDLTMYPEQLPAE